MANDINKRNECYFCEHMQKVPGNTHIKCNNPDPKMEGNEHGIKKGWFFYPGLFDPVWKTKKCSNFKSPPSKGDGLRAFSDGDQGDVPSDVSPLTSETIEYICDGCGQIIDEHEAHLFDGSCEDCYLEEHYS